MLLAVAIYQVSQSEDLKMREAANKESERVIYLDFLLTSK